MAKAERSDNFAFPKFEDSKSLKTDPETVEPELKYHPEKKEKVREKVEVKTEVKEKVKVKAEVKEKVFYYCYMFQKGRSLQN